MSREEKFSFGLHLVILGVYRVINGPQETMANNGYGYTAGYTNLGRKGTAVMYVVSTRRTEADNGVRDTKPKSEGLS